MKRHSLALGAALLLTLIAIVTVVTGRNHGVPGGGIELTKPWVRVMLSGQPTGAGYLIIENKGIEPDKLLSVSSPAASKVAAHEMTMDNDVMKMRELTNGLEIPGGETVEFTTGSYHLMFENPVAPFKEGDKIKVILKFEKAGNIEVEFPASSQATPAHDHSKMK